MRSEADFTAPHAACGHPERWHAPDPESTEAEVSELIGALIRAVQPDLVVETGAAYGHTTAVIGQALALNGHGVCWSLEVDTERAAVAAERCAQFEQVRIVLGSSLEWTPPGLIDFAFFDSAYETRAPEFLRFRRYMSPGAIVAFHDTTSALRGHYYDVREEVAILEAAGALRAVYLPTPRGIAICEVLEVPA